MDTEDNTDDGGNIIYTKGIEIFVYIILMFKCFKH